MRVLRKLKSKRGSGYIQFMVSTLMLMTILATFLEVAGLFVIKGSIQSIANETARYIELRGALNSAVYSEFDRLKGVTGVDAALSVDGDFSSGGKLHLEAPFTVTVSAEGHIFHLDVPLLGKATGRSEVYHK